MNFLDEVRADKLNEECGVFGAYSFDGQNVAGLAYNGLFALQHRGQESAGIAVNNAGDVKCITGKGLVTEVFSHDMLEKLDGHASIGHVRYSTEAESDPVNSQPMVIKYRSGYVALAHNGSLTNADELKQSLEEQGSFFRTQSDSEIILTLISKYRFHCKHIIDALKMTAKDIKGSYALTILTNNNLIGVRDRLGNRPLCMGKIGETYILASESVALDAVGAEFVRDLNPGEIVVINKRGVESFYLDDIPEKSKLCVFEHVYFARPDSIIDGASVYDTRMNVGRRLAKEHPADADLVIAAPDSGIAAAMGFAQESGLPYMNGLLKNRYVARTFIQPGQGNRELAVSNKFNPIKTVIKDKKLVLVDDSIVRGTTTYKLIKMLKDAGAKEVHMRVAAPPLLHPCFYGVDISNRKELIAVNRDVEEIRKEIGADSLGYISIEGLTDVPASKLGFCTACLSGEYPTELSEALANKAFCEVEKK